MKTVGFDFHPAWQQVAIFAPETGEMSERFYRELESPAPIGIEACGNSQTDELIGRSRIQQ